MDKFKYKQCAAPHSLCKIFVLIIILWRSTLWVSAQEHKTITGRITDSNGELLIGVNIIEKETLNGTVTNVDGVYTLTLTTAQPVIRVSYLGYKTQELRIGGKKIMDVVLNEEQSNLDEVVVVGFGKQRKISLVGAQSQLEMKDIKIPSANLGSAIAGRIPGIVAVQRTGEPGHDDSDIWIRGISTFTNQNTKPLILVDGVERDFSNMDPEDIESFSVLKDASATAVYGVRGANGVIIIKTKPGKAGKPKFSVDYYEGVSRFTKTVKLADGFAYMDAANDAYKNSTGSVKYTDAYIEATKKANGLIENDNPTLYNKYLYPNVDWMKEIFKDWGQNRRLNMNVQGGSTDANYYVSLSYYNEDGLTNTSTMEDYNAKMTFTRYNFTTNVNLKATEKTSINVGVHGYIAEGNYPAISTSDVFAQAMIVPPVDFPVLYPNGEIPGINPNGDSRNPYADVTRRGYKNEYQNKINSNVKVAQELDFWDWSKGLQFSALVAYDSYNSHTVSNSKRESTYFPLASKNADTGLWVDDPDNPLYDENGDLILTETYTGSSTLSYSKSTSGNHSTYVEASLNYERTFNEKHRVSGLLNFNQRVYQSADETTLIDALPNKDRGFASRVTYSYSDKYFGEFNIGYNGSENFSPKNRYGIFPAVAVGWVISNEAFWNSLKNSVSFFKIRFSDGIVGSDAIGSRRFGYITIVQNGQDGYTFGTSRTGYDGIAITDYGTDITWSTSHKYDLGLDLIMFRDALSLNIDLFKEHRTGIFLQRAAVPGFVGLSEMPWGNLGVIDNKGIEMAGEYRKQITDKINLSLRGNLTWNEDKIIENDEPEQVYPWLEKRGSNILARWGYIAEGLFENEEDILNHATQFGESNPGDISRVGDIKYKDTDGSGTIDSYDQVKIGHGDVPKLVYAFGTDIQYTRFSLGLLFQGVHKADRMLNGNSILPFSGDGGRGNLFSNIESRADNYISTDENGNEYLTSQDVFYPRLAWGGGEAANVNNFKESTWWLKEVSFLRLKQVSLSYYFPKELMDKLLLANGRVYFMASNVFTWSSFKLWDPELNTDNGTSYPNISTYSLGISFSF